MEERSATVRLRERVKAMHERGLRDLKFWFAGAPEEGPNAEALSEEALSILEAHEQERSAPDVHGYLK